jgi:hypothetical protein
MLDLTNTKQSVSSINNVSDVQDVCLDYYYNQGDGCYVFFETFVTTGGGDADHIYCSNKYYGIGVLCVL